MLLEKDTIIVWIFIAALIILLFFFIRLWLDWIKLKSEVILKESKNLPVEIPINKKFSKDFKYVLSSKISEFPGLFISGATLFLAIISILNSHEVSKLTMEYPDFIVKAKKYNYQKKEEIKLIISLKPGLKIKPKNPGIKYFPIFYVRNKENNWDMIPKDFNDFTNCENREIDFTENNYEIPSLMIYFCDQEKYSGLCKKIESKAAVLSGFRYMIYYNLGIGQELFSYENTVLVE
jgi:hypothetical protein